MALETVKAHGSKQTVRMGIFLLALLLLCATGIIAVGWFANPRGQYVSLGTLSSYPLSDQPYDITSNEAHLFVIHTGEGILVLDASSTRTVCYSDVVWNPARERFEDRCQGTRYLLDGRWAEGPPARDLDRYPFRIEGGNLTANLTQIIRGDESWRSQ